MFVITLLIPVVVPYGDPWTAFDPHAHYVRKAEFFKWIESVDSSYSKFEKVPFKITANIEKHEESLVEGKQEEQTTFVPTIG